jgi:hypothetical protein
MQSTTPGAQRALAVRVVTAETVVPLYDALSELQIVALRGDGVPLEPGEAQRIDNLCFRAGRSLALLDPERELERDGSIDPEQRAGYPLAQPLSGFARGLCSGGAEYRLEELTPAGEPALELVPPDGSCALEGAHPESTASAAPCDRARWKLENRCSELARELTRAKSDRDIAAAGSALVLEQLRAELAEVTQARDALQLVHARVVAELRAAESARDALAGDAIRALEVKR